MNIPDELYKAVREVVLDQIYMCPRSKSGLFHTVWYESNLEFENSSQAHQILDIALADLKSTKEIVKERDAYMGIAYAIPSDMEDRQELLHSMGIPPINPKLIKKKLK